MFIKRMMITLLLLLSSHLAFPQGSGNNIQFNGTTDVLQIPSGFQLFRPNANYGLPAAISFDFFFNIPSGGGGWVMGQSGGTNSFPHLHGSGGIYIDNSTIRYRWTSYNPSKTNVSFEATGISVPTDEWNHVAIVMDWPNQQAFIYLNGILQNAQLDQTVSNWGPDVTRNNNSLGFDEIGGLYFNNTNHYFNGQLDEIRIWNYVLDAISIREWIGKKMNATHPNNNALRAYYNLDESSGNQAIAFSGYPAHLPPFTTPDATLSGTPTRNTSSAPIGNESVLLQNFNGLSNGTITNLTVNNLGTISATIASGAPTSFLLYSVTESSNNSNLTGSLTSLDDQYFGVKVFGGSMPSYNLSIDYNSHDSYTQLQSVKLATRADNAAGQWTEISVSVDNTNNTIQANNLSGTEYILAASDCNLQPPIPVNDSICAVGNAQLSVNSNTTGVLWYDQQTGGNVVGTGTSFTTPHLTSTTNYYASSYVGGNSTDVLDFDGTDDYVFIGDLPNLRITGDLTIEAWIYPLSYGAQSTIYGKAGGGEGVLQMESSGVISFAFGPGANSGYGPPWYFINSGGQKPALNTWTHIAAVRDSANGILYLFFNGNLIAQKNETRHADISSLPAVIGQQGNNHFPGMIDEVRVWSSVKTQAQIISNMNQCLFGNEQSLQLYYKMDNGSGTTITDYSHNNYNGTLMNMADEDWVNLGPNINCIGCESNRVTVTAHVGIVPPTNLLTSNINENTATLKWTTTPNAVSYEIEYFNTSDSVIHNAFVSGSLDSLNIHNLLEGTSHRWRIRATCDVANSSTLFSDWSDFTTSTSICQIPGNLTESNINTTGVTFNWSSVLNIQSYEIVYGVLGSGLTSMIADANDTQLTISNLFSGTNYQWRIRALCSTGMYSDFSPFHYFSTSGNASCSAPTATNVSSITINTATFNWTEPTGGMSYEIQFGVHGSNTLNVITANNGTSSLNLSGLFSGTNYQIRIRTICNSNQLHSQWSDFIYFSTIGTAACARPTNTSVSGITNNSVDFNWTEPSGANSYQIQYGVHGSNTLNLLSVNSGTSSINIPGLFTGTNYQIRIRAICNSNVLHSQWSEFIYFATTGSAACSTPTGISITNITNNSATFNWTEPSGGVSYEIVYGVLGSGLNDLTSTVGSSSINLTGLFSGTTYQVRIRTVCTSNELHSQNSNFIYFNTTGSEACSFPTSLSTTAIGSTQATANWNQVSGSASYHIVYGIVGGGLNDQYVLGGTSESSVISGLSSNSNYRWRIRTICNTDQLQSTWSDWDYFTTTGSSSMLNTNAKTKLNNTIMSLLFEVYPNPSSGRVQIRYHAENKEVNRLLVYNSLGSIVFTMESSKGFNDLIDLSNFGKGMYFIKILNGKDPTIKRIIIR